MEKTAVVVAVKAPASSTDCNWTELPADLLICIFGTMQITDLFSSGGVCRSWRRSHLEARQFGLCSPHQSPCLVYSAADRDDGTATLHHLATDKLCHIALPDPTFRSRYVMGSSHGWLITADERSHLILVNPITGAQIFMPPPETMHNVRLRYDEEDDGKLDGYDLIYMDTVPQDFHGEIRPYGVSLAQGRFCFYETVAMLCDPSSKGCIVVRVHKPNQLLSYARVGDTKWSWVDTHEECKHYVGICYDSGDGLFYDIRGCADVHTIDLRGPSPVVNIVYKHRGCYSTDSKYIVQAPWGEFFQIWRWDRYLEDGDEVVEEDDDDDADEIVDEEDEEEIEFDVDEQGELMYEDSETETESEEDEVEEENEEIESDVEEHEEVKLVNVETKIGTEVDEERVENEDVSVEKDSVDVPPDEEVDEQQAIEEEKERVTARFVVQKIDFLKQKLIRVRELKDHVLFTGFNTSFLLSVKDFPTLIPNSIYHTDDLNHNTFSKRFSDRRRALIDPGLRQVLIFNMKDSSFTDILAPKSSRLNWPPPVWIQP